MATFSEARFGGSLGCSAGMAYGPDNRSLSVILQGTEIRDQVDSDERYASLTFDLAMSLAGDTHHSKCTIDVRGSSSHAGRHAFGVVRIYANGQRSIVSAVEENGELFTNFEVALDGKPTLDISVLILTNAGLDSHSESLIALDSIDLHVVDA